MDRFLKRFFCRAILVGCLVFPFWHTAEAKNTSSVVSSDHGITVSPFLAKDENGLLTLGNVRWGLKTKNPRNVPNDLREYHWQNAVLNPEMVDEIYYISRPFKPEAIAAHVFMVFTFRSGGFTGEDGFRPEGLVISYEALRKPGDPFNMWHGGMQRAYGIGCIMATWEDFVAVDCDLIGNRYLPNRLILSHEQKVALTRASILAGTRNLAGQKYHTLENNCILNQLTQINGVLPPAKRLKQRVLNGRFINPLAPQPKFVPLFFIRKGIFEARNVVIDVSNYFVPLNKLIHSSSIPSKTGSK